MKKLLIISLLLITTNAIADIDVTGKFVPKNDGFTGIVDGDQVICSEAANMLPAACYAVTYTGYVKGVTYTNYTKHSTITEDKWCIGDGEPGTIICTEDAPAGVGDMTKAVYDADEDGEVGETESNQTWTLHDDYPAACYAGEFVTAIGDTLTCDSEDDPQVGAVTNGKWCAGNGSSVECDQDAPSGLDIDALDEDAGLADTDLLVFSDDGDENSIEYQHFRLSLAANNFSILGTTIDTNELKGVTYTGYVKGVTYTGYVKGVTYTNYAKYGTITQDKWCTGDATTGTLSCTEDEPAGGSGALPIDNAALKIPAAVTLTGAYTYAANATAALHVIGILTKTGIANTGLQIDNQIKPNASNDQIHTGIGGYTNVKGMQFASPAEVRGLDFTNYFGYTSAGTIANAYGTRSIGATAYLANVYMGSSSSIYGVYAASTYNIWSGDIHVTNTYGLYVDDIGSGVNIVNNYMVYVDTPTTGTNDYQVFLLGTGNGTGIWFGGVSTYKRLYNDGTELCVDDQTSGLIQIGRGNTDTDATYIMLKSKDGTWAYIYPHTDEASIVVSTTRP